MTFPPASRRYVRQKAVKAYFLVFFLTAFLSVWSQAVAEVRDVSQGWSFHKGDVNGAEQASFDDRNWLKVSVPHDWSIMDKADGAPPFDPAVAGGQDSGYLPGGVGWYRYRLNLKDADTSKVTRLNFEAVYMDADIWVNGTHAAKHRFGYSAFTVDLTGKVRAGDNIIAVRVNHVDPSSRWYAGSGIIRPVNLEVLNCVHITPDSVFVTTPDLTEAAGVARVASTVKNCGNKNRSVEYAVKILAPDGSVVAQTTRSTSVPAHKDTSLEQNLTVTRPKMWSPDSPALYTLVQEVRIEGKVVDERRTRFGFRTVTMDAANGLRVNGKPILLKGGNIHHDNYMIGAAGSPDADRRKVVLMKAAGYNAVRSAHNPASQATLDAADELGMLVINEAFDAWNNNKRPMDYARFFKEDWPQDLTSLVISGRNHPSVIMWSIGNEIPEQGTPLGVETGRKLAEHVRKLDPTRPVTQAVNAERDVGNAQFPVMDIAGYNYRAHFFAEDHKDYPERVMYTAESTPKDAFTYWRLVETMPWVIGDFVWTAVDYLGESGIGWMGYTQDWQKLGPYPWHLAYSGEIDATGRKRPAAFYRQVMWKSGIDPVAAFVKQPEGTEDLPDRNLYPITPPHLDWSLEDIHPSWTWRGQEGKTLDVVVFSEFPEVELFLNDKSLGRKPVSVASEYRANYRVPYAPGQLIALGYDKGREAGRWELKTAGASSGFKVTVDRQTFTANGQDLAYVTIELTDAQGVPIYAQTNDRKVTVKVSGAGTLAGIGNGNPQDASSFQSGMRKTFHGRVVAVVKASLTAGPITVKIDAEGMASQQVQLTSVAP
ncbi:DUF4982 domain-containing protein [Asticcacaulis sp. SL142]|uniref:glycoside hydrolase family 2 TIM barrel-domain containing protein n=1 Tax=Asticcacaulis sp. SL142 TaxID=2995155 RepID=UPI00226CDE9E|nr:glycoside hydrolase family 2 TIM barrel-domain containing protein [Asticcacaulis sp. SL142]WAC49451.1 DUF4982 domain-containing protein [Asticcacaulis sp. SL142]